MPPRPAFLRYTFKKTNTKTGRINFTRFDAEPCPHFCFAGVQRPGKGFQPEGYVARDVGPERWVGKGEVEFEVSMAKLIAERRVECPFAKL
ncbi:uncharacterized protein N7500_001984 [Penicillium coprophilum]|uniref:uncharacterized protein n=1 Tax=Penicillium coprophilum TaxID=36646 RepID=UPI0023A184C4|nr:uncharacterized protein N7500_001984 [Penicillium coprophilum]KAJ5174053.1 hypothetical protein N7500_001984 [Penicillium coprophilum]